MRKFITKHWSTILLGIFLLLMLMPKTRLPIQVFIQRLIALSPNTIDQDKQVKLTDYHLTYENEDQQQFNLIDNKGKVVLINFWATWCPPCIAEMPSYKELYTDYKEKIDFLFITQDDWSTIHKFEEKRTFDLPYYRLISSNNQLRYTQLPTTYLIDAQGNVVLEHIGVADWNSDSFREKLDKIIQE